MTEYLRWQLSFKPGELEKLEKEAANARKAGKLDHGSIERLAGAPKLPVEYDFYVEAFRTIASDRPSNMAAGRIGWSMVVRYGKFYGLTKREIEELWFVIKAMDEVVLSSS